MPRNPSKPPKRLDQGETLPYYDTGRKRRTAQDRHWWENETGQEGHFPTKLKDLPFDHPDFPHGDTGWQYGCRCDKCIADHNIRRAIWRRNIRQTNPRTEYIPKAQRAGRKIGTRSCYNVCHKRKEGAHPECEQANRDYARNYARGITATDPMIEAAMQD